MAQFPGILKNTCNVREGMGVLPVGCGEASESGLWELLR